jgi:PKD repeat protein
VGEEWYREKPAISLSNTENAEIYYWWDGGAPQLYGGPVSANEGEHELGYQSRDAAGNTEKARTAMFKVDTAPPEAQLSVTNTSLILGDIIGADASESSDSVGIEAYSIDFGDGYRRMGATRSWDHQYDAPGTYSIVLKVRDQSGQWSEPVSANVTVSLPPRPPAAPSTPGTLISQSTILAAAAAIIIIAVATAAALRKRRGAP